MSNTTNKTKYTSELFDDKETAELAYNDAINQGYTPEEITVIMSEDARKKYYDSDLAVKAGDKSMEGLAIGGALGGVLGGTLGAIAAIGTAIVFPGVGLIVSGPLLAGLAGAGAGSIAGGLLGALVGWGIPEERAKEYERGLKSGGIVLIAEEKVDRPSLSTTWKKYKTRTTV